MDYGCGHGDDVQRLRLSGYDCDGWDPVLAPDGRRRSASVVNLGYVVNVIEHPSERVQVLRDAWSFAQKTLVVSARLVDEKALRTGIDYSDGLVTRIGTFQKFFEQQELRNWIECSLETPCIAAAPGVFYVFRDAEARTAFAAARFRRSAVSPRLRLTEQLAIRHREALDALGSFLAGRGRLPVEGELPFEQALTDAFGSLRRAYRYLTANGEGDLWDRVRKERSEDLLLYLALAKFDARPRAHELPIEMQADVKAFFGTYTKACRQADQLLFGLGDQDCIDAAASESPVGKLLPTALYVHVSSTDALSLPLRLYEGCARAALGTVEAATIIKLRRDEPKVSYLVYPTFDDHPHPALAESVSLHLQTLRTKTRRYSASANPPILHRKEAFVSPDYPRRSTFERLTASEERHGLYADSSRIGTRDGWAAVVTAAGLEYRGHRLVKRAGAVADRDRN